MSAAAEIRVAGRADSFMADGCTVEYGTVTATGRWRTRTGPGYRRIDYSEPVTRTWPIAGVAEIRWATTSVAA